MSNLHPVAVSISLAFRALSCFLIGGLLFEPFRWLWSRWRKRY